MQDKNGVWAICVSGLIVIAATLTAFFLLNIEHIPINIWALAFLLLAEIVLFSGLTVLRIAKTEQAGVFVNAGIATALFLYFILTLISALSAGAFKDKLNNFILIELAIIAIFSIITISVLAYSGVIKRRMEEDIKKTGTIEPRRGGF